MNDVKLPMDAPRRAGPSIADYRRDTLGVPEVTAEEHSPRGGTTTKIFGLSTSLCDERRE